VARLGKEIALAMEDPALRQRMLDLGAEPTYVAADAFGRFFRDESVKWARVVKDMGIQAD
jgi:tripartite-type tricarboxylate transporter receptor subunit TctC